MQIAKGTMISGIASSEHLDSSGERIIIKGMDISSLEKGEGTLTWEHKNDNSSQVIGKIVFAKKIYSEPDCKSEDELKFWNISKAPFVYIIGELFDALGHTAAKDAAAMLKYDALARKEGRPVKNTINFSVEGAKLEKSGNEIVRSIARKTTLTTSPCNKKAIAEIYTPIAPAAPVKKKESLWEKLGKSEDAFSILEKNLPYRFSAPKPGSAASPSPAPAPKAQPAAPAPQPQMAGAKLGSTSSGKEVFSHTNPSSYGRNFSAKDHHEAGSMHYDASQSAKNPADAQHHIKQMKMHFASRDRADKIADIKRQKIKSLAPAKKSLEKTLTAGGGNAAPSSLVGGAALTKENLDGAAKSWSNYGKALSYISEKKPQLDKSEAEVLAKYMAFRAMKRAETVLAKMSGDDSLSKSKVNPKLMSDKPTHIHPEFGKVKSVKSYNTDQGKCHTLEIMEGPHKGKLTNHNDSDLKPIGELAKSKNVREQKKKVFGTDPNAPRVSDKRMKMMQRIRQYVKGKYGMNLETAQGKRNQEGELREDADLAHEPFDVFSEKGHKEEKRRNAKLKARGEKRVDPKPHWIGNQLETQPSPDAAIHETAHLDLAPEGRTPEQFQLDMDAAYARHGKEYGHAQGKRTAWEVQPMALENPIRREMGLPANRTTKEPLSQEAAAKLNAGRSKKGLPPLEIDEKGSELTFDDKRPRFNRGTNDKFYDRQSRLMSPETKDRLQAVRSGTLKFHPEKGWYRNNDSNALVNLRGQGQSDEATRRLKAKYGKSESMAKEEKPKPNRRLAARNYLKGSSYGQRKAFMDSGMGKDYSKEDEKLKQTLKEFAAKLAAKNNQKK